MNAAAVGSRPLHILGLPAATWAFALRNWIAMLLALYVAFWLQLESASSAATCVAILSLQTRGQALQKAVFRTVGTIIGVVASILIAGIFSQTRDLFILACAIWLGLCVMVASLLDGNRAYGAVLSGYTVAIVALPNIDTPLQTFSSGLNRGAAITVGILAMAVVSNVFGAPDLYPDIVKKLEATQDKVRAFAIKAVRQGSAEPAETAALMKEITALHPDITALPTESLRGRAHAQAAMLAAVSLLREIAAARVVSRSLSALGEAGMEPRENLLRALDGRPHDPPQQRAFVALADPGAPEWRRIAASAALVLFEQDEAAMRALIALRRGHPPERRTSIRLFKSRQAALRNGLRTLVAFSAAAYALSLTGWPATTTALLQIGAFLGLSATSPSPRGFALGALIAIPLVVATAGITEFFILDGVDAFPLLVLGMGPAIFIASLVLSSSKALWHGVGFLMLVFFPVLLAPSNPQNYDPQDYLNASSLFLAAAVGLFILLSVILPTSPERQRRWILETARADLRTAFFGSLWRLGPQGSVFYDADRIGQFAGLGLAGDTTADLRHLFRISDLAACARRLRSEFTDRVLQRAWPDAVSALRRLDVPRLRQHGAEMLRHGLAGSGGRRLRLRRIAMDLMFAAVLIEHAPELASDVKGPQAR